MKFRIKNFFYLFVSVMLAVVYMFIESYFIEIKKDEIISEEVPKEFNNIKIVFVSDIHCSWYFGEKRVRKIADKINELKPDIILLGGDYIYGSEKYIQECFSGVSNLKSKYGIYAVLGNHEQHGTKIKIVKKIKENGFFLLDNDFKWIKRGNDKIKICGVADYIWDTPKIEKSISDTKKEDFVIMVSHNPDYVEKINSDKVDIILAGHTHGGQFTFFRQVFPFKNSENGTKYLGGVVKNKNNIVLVSNGVGTIVLPMRFCAKPQINELILKNNKKSEPIKVR